MAAYVIDPERSHVRIDARSTLHPICLRADGIEGELALGPREEAEDSDEPAAVPLAGGRLSLRVERLHGANRLEDVELRRQVEADRHPTIDGVLTGAEALEGDGRYRLSGEVTFRGVARAYQGDVVLEAGPEGTVTLSGEAVFDIRDFGMEPPRVLLMRVEPEVAVAVQLVLVPAGRGTP